MPPRIHVVLGSIDDVDADLTVLPGRRPHVDGRVVTVRAPRWHAPDGPERAIAQAYRDAVAAASDRGAISLAVPAVLARGLWPIDQSIHVALRVFDSTPSTVQAVTVVARSPGMLERWAEALIARDRWSGRRATP